MKMMRVCAGVLAGVLAASAVVMPVEPVFVYAEDLSPAVDAFVQSVLEWASNSESIVNLDADLTYYMPIAFVRAYVVYLENAYSANVEFDLSGITYVNYYRIVSNGDIYVSNVYLNNKSSGVCCDSPHFRFNYTFVPPSSSYTITVTPRTSVSTSIRYYTLQASTGDSGVYTSLTVDDTFDYFISNYSTSAYSPSFTMTATRDYIPVISSGGRVSSSVSIGGFPKQVIFPSGNVSKASPWDYYNDLLIPYLQDTYPDFPPEYFPPAYEPETPDIPYEPIYPTDFVTGVPKDWTITNPQLPSIPDLDFQIPTADFESLDVSPIRQNLSGVGFWWDLLETVLDTTAFKGLFLAFAIIGLAIFVLWKLGA